MVFYFLMVCGGELNIPGMIHFPLPQGKRAERVFMKVVAIRFEWGGGRIYRSELFNHKRGRLAAPFCCGKEWGEGRKGSYAIKFKSVRPREISRGL